MEKPRSIKVFDILFAAGWMLGLAWLVIGWDESVAVLASGNISATGAAAVMVFSIAIGYDIGLLLWFFISRRRSNIARWLFTALSIYALGSIFFDQNEYVSDLGADLIDWSGWLLEIAEVICLFLPDSARWFAGRYDGHEEIRDTFS